MSEITIPRLQQLDGRATCVHPLCLEHIIGKRWQCPLCNRRFSSAEARARHCLDVKNGAHENVIDAIWGLRYELADARYLLAEAQETIEELRRQRDEARAKLKEQSK